MPLVTSGVDHGNLRELALKRMQDLNLPCRDVRTREVGIQEIHNKVTPENVELISRYHNIDGTGGFAILESTDAAALADYALDWNGLIEIVITSIMDDETIGSVLGKKFG